MRSDARAQRAWAVAAVLGLLVLAGCSESPTPTVGEVAPVDASATWPQWRGPNRDGISTETGLLKVWPEGGPVLAWKAEGLGKGFATVAIADGLIYTAGTVDGHTVISALDLDGGLQWQVGNGSAWKEEYPGARGTPTLDGGRLYHEGPHGDVACLDARTGERIWSLNLLEAFGGRNIQWALAESLLIDGTHVIACPGGETAAMVALDKQTGATVWVCRGAGDKPGYASPIVFEYQGLRQIVTLTATAAIGVHAGTGKLLWRHPHKTSWDANIPTPIYHDGHVFICSGYGSGAELLRLRVAGESASVERVWSQKALDNHHGGVVLVDGYLYGSNYRGRWVCLDFQTGEVQYTVKGVGKGSLTYADGMLYTYSEDGTMGLVRATPQGHEVISEFRVPKGGRGKYWPHPVVCGSRLYLRHADALYAYDVKGT